MTQESFWRRIFLAAVSFGSQGYCVLRMCKWLLFLSSSNESDVCLLVFFLGGGGGGGFCKKKFFFMSVAFLF